MNQPSRDRRDTGMRFPSGHVRVLGPPGTGKTTLLLRRFAELDAETPGSARILTYSRQSHERLLDAVTERAPARFERPPVYTYLSCAAEAFPRSPEIIGGAEERIVFDEVARSNASRLSSPYKTMLSSDRFQKAALDLFHILMQNGVSGERFEALRASVRGGGRLGDMLELYGAFRSVLEERALATFYDLVWKAVDHIREHPDLNPFGGVRTVLVEDFQDIDAGQYALLTVIAPPDGAAAVNVFGDPTGARFGFRGTDHRFLMSTFPAQYGGETRHLSLPANGLRRLLPAADALVRESVPDDAERYLRVSPGNPDGRSPEEPDEPQVPRGSHGPDGRSTEDTLDTVRIVKARDEYEEISFVAASIRALLDENAIAPHSIAVAARHKRAYEPIVSMIFRQHGVPLETGRTRHTMVRSMVQALVRLVQRPDDEMPLEMISTSGLRPHLERVLAGEAGGGTAEPDTRPEFGPLVRRYASNLKEREPSRWFEALLLELVIPAADASCAPAGEFARGREARDLLDGWKRYATFMRSAGRPADSATFVRIGGMLDDALGVTSPAAGRVGFYSCHELNNRFFSAVFIVGCSETIFPALQDPDALVPYGELQAALEAALPERPPEIHAARSPEARMKDEYGLLLHAAARATRVLVMTAPEQFGGQYYPAPSFILSEERGCAVEERPPGVFVPPLASLSRTALGEDRRLLEGMAGTFPLALCYGTKPDPPRSFSVPPFALSKSSLGAYAYCPRKFFYDKVLRVPEKRLIEFEVGNLLHRVLEEACRMHPSQEALAAYQRSGGVQDLIARVLADDQRAAGGVFYERLLERRLAILADRFFALESGRADSYLIADFEKKFIFAFGGWSFAGGIDRIDREDGGRSRVIDYKTGSGEKKRAATLRDKVVETDSASKDRNWQVPLYAWAMHDMEGVFPSAYSHYLLPAKDEARIITLEIVASEGDWVPPPAGPARDASSYVLHGELRTCMEQACGVAAEIFGPRVSFERTENAGTCYRCRFRATCRRYGNGAE